MIVVARPPARTGQGRAAGSSSSGRSRWTTARIGRIGRYAATSVLATGVSEATLLAVYGGHVLSASLAAVVASVAGVVPSYAMSRYWIWPEGDRRRPGRQAVAFWVIALISLGLSSLLTGLAAADGPSGHVAHLVVVGLAYVGTYGALWAGKFVVYQRYLFRPAPVAADVGVPAPSPDDRPPG